MLRRNVRLRREYLYQKNLEGKERLLYEKKRKIKQALEEGKPILTELIYEEASLRAEIDLEDENTAVPRSHIDDEYAGAAEKNPKILLTQYGGDDDVWIGKTLYREMQERLRDETNQKLFVTEEDIKRLPFFQNETLIAIKAPHGTTLEVPDPDDAVDYPQRRYMIILRSTMGKIDVYLVRYKLRSGVLMNQLH